MDRLEASPDLNFITLLRIKLYDRSREFSRIKMLSFMTASQDCHMQLLHARPISEAGRRGSHARTQRTRTRNTQNSGGQAVVGQIVGGLEEDYHEPQAAACAIPLRPHYGPRTSSCRCDLEINFQSSVCYCTGPHW